MRRTGAIGLAAVIAIGLVWWVATRDEGTLPPPVDVDGGGGDGREEAPEREPPDPNATGARERPDEEPLPEGAVRIFGIVVTPDEKPAAGARVDLAFGVSAEVATKTGPDGAFSLVLTAEALGDRYSASIRVRDDAGHGLLKSVRLRGAPTGSVGPEIDLGTLVILVGSSLDVRTILPPGARPPVTVRFLQIGTWWSGGLFAKAEADASGVARVEGIPPGSWRILANAEGAGRGQLFVKLPQKTPETVEIELEEEKIGVLTVVDAETGAPVVGAKIRVQEFVRTPGGNFQQDVVPKPAVTETDERGRIELRGFSAKSSLTIYVMAEGYPLSVDRSGVSAVAAVPFRRNDTDVVVKLARARTISWPVVSGPTGTVPADGTPIRMKALVGSGRKALPEGGVIENARLVVGGWGPGIVSALAVAPDGSMARLWAGADAESGKEIRFVPARSIEVTLTYPDGAPASGLFITLANQGNNPLTDPVETDAGGKVRIEDLFGGKYTLVEIRVADTNTQWGGTKLATVNLEEGDAKVSGTVQRAVRVTLRITVDGAARIPGVTEESATGGIQVWFGGAYIAKPDVDAERGVVSFDWRPRPGMKVAPYRITKDGFLPCFAKLPLTEPPGPIAADVVLLPGGSILVKGKLPADGRHRVNLQRWDGEKGAWVGMHLQVMAMGGYARYDANGEVVLQPIPTGRYRVVDTSNFVVSEAVDVVAGAPPPTVVLDASKAGSVRGRVEAPEGVPLKGLKVLVDGGPELPVEFGASSFGGEIPKGIWTRTNEKGEFWLRVPGNVRLTLYGDGTGLEPAPEGGRVVLTEPRDGVVLKLVKGSTGRVRFSRPLRVFMNPGRPRPLRVAFYADEVEGEPVKVVNGMLDGDGTSIVFGVVPGIFTVWIDAEPFVPVVLRGVRFEKGENDLGEATVSDGTKVTVEVRLKPGEAMPRMYLYARHLGRPAYGRRGNSGKRTTFSLSGLGPGRFRLTAGSHMGMGLGRALNEEIEVDGTGEITRVLDLTK